MKVKKPILQDFKIFERNGLVFQIKKSVCLPLALPKLVASNTKYLLCLDVIKKLSKNAKSSKNLIVVF